MSENMPAAAAVLEGQLSALVTAVSAIIQALPPDAAERVAKEIARNHLQAVSTDQELNTPMEARRGRDGLLVSFQALLRDE